VCNFKNLRRGKIRASRQVSRAGAPLEKGKEIEETKRQTAKLRSRSGVKAKAAAAEHHAATMNLTGAVPRTLMDTGMLTRWLQHVSAISLVEHCIDEQWSEKLLTTMSACAMRHVEDLQHESEEPLSVLLDRLTDDERRSYTRDSVLDPRITQREPDEGSSGLCAWKVSQVLSWLEDERMRSLIEIADDDHWSGMMLRNLAADETKKIEKAQSSGEPLFRKCLANLMRSFPNGGAQSRWDNILICRHWAKFHLNGRFAYQPSQETERCPLAEREITRGLRGGLQEQH